MFADARGLRTLTDATRDIAVTVNQGVNTVDSALPYSYLALAQDTNWDEWLAGHPSLPQ